MKSDYIAKDGALSIQEINKPPFTPQRSIRRWSRQRCGMCSTDVKLYHRTFKGESVYPIMLGHEEGRGRSRRARRKNTGFKLGDEVLLPFVDADEENNPGLGSGWGRDERIRRGLRPATPTRRIAPLRRPCSTTTSTPWTRR